MWLDPLSEQTDAPDPNTGLLAVLLALVVVWGMLAYAAGWVG